jgi:large subunit ribosomal protein L7/L12
MADLKKLMKDIKELTVLELSEFVKALEKEFGVSAAAPVAVAAAPAAAGKAAAAPAEEKTEFNVVLTSFGEKKIDVIRVVRELTGLGLVEAKTLVEAAPSTVKEAVGKDTANQMVEKLKAVGAKAELK